MPTGIYGEGQRFSSLKIINKEQHAREKLSVNCMHNMLCLSPLLSRPQCTRGFSDYLSLLRVSASPSNILNIIWWRLIKFDGQVLHYWRSIPWNCGYGRSMSQWGCQNVGLLLKDMEKMKTVSVNPVMITD